MLHRIKHVAIAIFLVITFVLPLWPFVADPADIRTDFTWDMFAAEMDCSPCTLYMQIGDEPRLRVPWGLRHPNPIRQRHEFDEFEALGRGALRMSTHLGQNAGPAVNLRGPVQVARTRHRGRLENLARAYCAELETVFIEAMEDASAHPPWARILGARWESAGRDLRFFAECRCTYNQGEVQVVGDPSVNLCASEDS